MNLKLTLAKRMVISIGLALARVAHAGAGVSP
jgi:hypothetical protein